MSREEQRAHGRRRQVPGLSTPIAHAKLKQSQLFERGGINEGAFIHGMTYDTYI